MKNSSQQLNSLLYGILACSLISCANVDNISPSHTNASTVNPPNISLSHTPSVNPMILSQSISNGKISNSSYPKSLASYKDFKNLVTNVESVRENRLINAKTFATMAKEPSTIILDTRSADFFASAHIKGSVNLPFSEFTQSRLAEVIPNTGTRILIYCNNNFADDQINFPSKVVIPVSLIPNQQGETNREQMLSEKKPIMLALNIPTFINLYGYGYQNIYELDELVQVSGQVLTIESNEDTHK